MTAIGCECPFFGSFHVLYIYSDNWMEMFPSRFPTILSYVRLWRCPDVEMSGYRDTGSWFGDFFRSQGQFLSEFRSRMTKFKLFECSHLPYNFPSSSVKILRFYFHFWLELDRVSSTYIRMDPSSGLILA